MRKSPFSWINRRRVLKRAPMSGRAGLFARAPRSAAREHVTVTGFMRPAPVNVFEWAMSRDEKYTASAEGLRRLRTRVAIYRMQRAAGIPMRWYQRTWQGRNPA